MNETKENVFLSKSDILNKFEKNKLKNTNGNDSIDNLDHIQFFKNPDVLQKYKLPELKQLCKNNKLYISGTKTALISRVSIFFNRTKNTILIQAIFRRWIVKKSMKLRGPAYRNASICVNDTDFVTLEPLNEIPHYLFFSYKDSKDFVYGFSISSLMQIIKTKGKISNPYNREKIEKNILNDIITLYNISFLIYKNFKLENEPYVTGNTNAQIRTSHVRATNNNNFFNNNNMFNNINTNNNIINNNDYIEEGVYAVPPIFNNIIISTEQNARLNQLENIRRRTIDQRINDLFMELDQLGNYTNSNWFTSLERGDFIRLYRSLHDIWYYRSQMTREVKLKVCPYFNPFQNVFFADMHQTNTNNVSYESVKRACLLVFENLIYTGFDDDSRRLGAFHSLSALTIVSPGARAAMPWLYEAVAFV